MKEAWRTWLGLAALVVGFSAVGYILGTFVRAGDLEDYRRVMRGKVGDLAEASRATDTAEENAISSVESLAEDFERFRDGSTDWKEVVGDIESTMETLVDEVGTLKEAAAEEAAALKSLKKSAEKEPGTPTYED